MMSSKLNLDPNIVGEKLINKLLEYFPKDFDWSRLHVDNKTTLCIFKSDEGNMIALGCRYCFAGEDGLDSLGEPTLDGEKLLKIEQVKEAPQDLPIEVASNLWFCPCCHKPITKYMPKFG